MHQENQKVFDFYTVFFFIHVAYLYYSIVFAEYKNWKSLYWCVIFRFFLLSRCFIAMLSILIKNAFIEMICLPLLIFFSLFSFAHLNCYQHKFTLSAGVYCNFYEQSKHRFIACTSVETMT